MCLAAGSLYKADWLGVLGEGYGPCVVFLIDVHAYGHNPAQKLLRKCFL